MTVCFLGAIRSITGRREQAVSDHATVQGMMDALMERYGDPWRERVYDGRGLVPDVVVMVNGRNIEAMGGLATPLALDDRVDIFPMFEGG